MEEEMDYKKAYNTAKGVVEKLQKENAMLREEVEKQKRIAFGDLETLDNNLAVVMRARVISELNNFIPDKKADNIFDVIVNIKELAEKVNNPYVATIYRESYILLSGDNKVLQTLLHKAGWEKDYKEFLNELRDMGLLETSRNSKTRKQFSMCHPMKTVYDESSAHLIDLKECYKLNIV